MRAWERTLEAVARRLNDAQIEWMLVGSAATALRGAAITPGDIDVLLPTAAAVRTAAVQFPCRPDRWLDDDPATWHSSVCQPVLTWEHELTRWTFARWTIEGTKVELAHLDSPDADNRLSETHGAAVWSVLETLTWRGVSLPMVPIEVQIATMISRGQEGRLDAVLSAVGAHDLDRGLLSRALAHRRIDASGSQVPPAIRRRP